MSYGVQQPIFIMQVPQHLYIKLVPPSQTQKKVRHKDINVLIFKIEIRVTYQDYKNLDTVRIEDIIYSCSVLFSFTHHCH